MIFLHPVAQGFPGGAEHAGGGGDVGVAAVQGFLNDEFFHFVQAQTAVQGYEHAFLRGAGRGRRALDILQLQPFHRQIFVAGQ